MGFNPAAKFAVYPIEAPNGACPVLHRTILTRHSFIGPQHPNLGILTRILRMLANTLQHAEDTVEKLGLLAILDAKPGKEQDLATFLESAQPLAMQEGATVAWYAIKIGPGQYGIFDTFENEGGRSAHLTGEIAKALFAKADELLAKPPQVEKIEILALKPRG